MVNASRARDSIIVVAAVVQRGQHVLICQRPAGGRHAGLWEFPGGKVRPGESEPEALGRELDEELGLHRVRVGARLFEAQDPGSPYLMRFYACEVDDEPRAIEHQAVQWCAADRLLALPLAPADRRCVEDMLLLRR
jgi:(d)CTP diphosphatase